MEPFGNSKKGRQQPAADLPQWNARFRFTAQKGAYAAADNSKDVGDAAKARQQERSIRTPHLASGAKRVPLGKKGSNSSEGGGADAVTPLTPEKTPTLCLFQRFENLTLTTPATATATKPAVRSDDAAAGMGSASVAEPASCGSTSSSNSSHAAFTGQPATAAGAHATAAQGRGQRSVAFGTPCVLAYTPASPAVGTVQQDTTPLWSNAGHTPYSLDGKDSGEGGCVRAVCCGADDAADAAGEADVISAYSSGVCLELFTSTITETELQHTPVASMTAPRTPADAPAAAGGKLCMSGNGSKMPTKGAAADKAQQGAAAAAAAPSCSDDSCFTGFGLSAAAPEAADKEGESTPPFFNRLGPAAEKEEEEASTPVLFGKTASNAAAAADSSATSAASCEASSEDASQGDSASSFMEGLAGLAGEAEYVTVTRGKGVGVGGGNSSSSSCMLGLAATPRSRLKQPARVPMEGSRPTISKELKQLLSDPQAAAALQPSAVLGTCDVLSPVRPKKQLQHVLGAGEQVLSPVRRSTRKAARNVLAADSAAVTPMLEATNYCYHGRGDSQQQPFGQ